MASFGQTFEVDELPVNDSFDPIPPGWYTALITKSELKTTKNGLGQYINLRFDITGPSHQGRVVFTIINVKNSSPTAEKIGREQLGSLMRAIGLSQINDSDELLNGNLQVKVDIKEETKDPYSGRTYDKKNEIRGYRAIDNIALPPTVERVPAFNPPASKENKAPPFWIKK
jgi:hypothetical protein